MHGEHHPEALLLLFDIDGTLVGGATDEHRDALHAALRKVHGINAAALRRPLRPAGRTDGDIARSLLLDAGISAERIDDRAAAVCEECCRVYACLCPRDLRHTVFAGVPGLLDWLSRQTRVELGLLTGNYEAVARLKLARAGIGTYFRPGLGAFGTDSEDRSALPSIARRRAGTRGMPHPRGQTLVIGDTPRDIACARADGVRCIAVATGPYRADQLAGADAVVPDANAMQAILAERFLGLEA